MNISLKAVRSGFDFETCWVAPNISIDRNGLHVLSMSKLTLTGSDVFDGSYLIYSEDSGDTWSEPVQPEVFKRRENDFDGTTCCEIFPVWNKATKQMLGFGNVINYTKDNVVDHHNKRFVTLSVLDSQTREWSSPKAIELPQEIDNVFVQPGMQVVELDDGDILLALASTKLPHMLFTTYVVRLRVADGAAQVVEYGRGLDMVKQPRGLYEPSLIKFAGRYFMALRNDISGYIAFSEDGLNFCDPKPWCFDNGELLGNYNTQQRWVRNGDDELYLVYTRRNADNDNVFRHRGPLFIAQVDTENLCVLRDTEQVLVPNRGARMGNFNALQVDDKKALVTVAEWMQNDDKGFGRSGVEYCMSFGSDNSVFLAEITW